MSKSQNKILIEISLDDLNVFSSEALEGVAFKLERVPVESLGFQKSKPLPPHFVLTPS